jgi:hypothetical protein
MTEHKFYFNSVYREIIANSLFTERQTHIIFNRLAHKTVPENISRGAYYRQLTQCRNKINGVLYSLLLLKSIGVIDQQALSVIVTLSDQLNVILEGEDSDIIDNKSIYNVMFTLKQIVKKIGKV